MLQKTIKLKNICRLWEKIQNLINAGPLITNKAAWPGKNPKFINVRHTFIPDYKVHTR